LANGTMVLKVENEQPLKQNRLQLQKGLHKVHLVIEEPKSEKGHVMVVKDGKHPDVKTS